MAQNSEPFSFGGAFFGLAVIWIVSDVWSSGWFNQGWYALRYGLPASEIHVDVRPQDCDFMHAPLGSKGCRYEAVVSAYNAAGDLVGGKGAPQYGHDTKTGKPIVSWDEGKTWAWITTAEAPDQKIKSVNVSWVKNAD